MVIFLGSNPSKSAKSLDSKSSKTINNWVNILGLQPGEYKFVNVANYPTPDNRPLRRSEIDAELPRLFQELNGHYVVCLGHTARNVCMNITLAMGSGYRHFINDAKVQHTIFKRFEHPSGLNRNLNNKEKMTISLDKLRKDIDRFHEINAMRVWCTLFLEETYKASWKEEV